MRFFILFGLFFTTFSQANTDNERTLFDLETIDIESVNEFIKAGVNVNAQGIDGITYLHFAIATKHIQLELVEVLIKAGADVNAQDNNGRTPLHWVTFATLKNITELIKALTKAGASLNIQDEYRATPLHLAVTATHEKTKEVVEALIEAGADLNAQNKGGLTPLELAFSYEGMHIFEEVKQIIETETDLDNLSISDVINHISKDHSTFYPGIEVIKTLIKAGANTNMDPSLLFALQNKTLLLEYTTDVNLQNKMRSIITEALRNLLAEVTHQKRTTFFQSIKNICSRVFQ